MNHLKKIDNRMSDLEAKNADLKTGLASVHGKILYLENKLEKVKRKIGEVEWKEMQNDLVLYKVE